MKNKTIAIVPAFNEEKTIKKVIINLRRYVKNVIVIDDASKDYTYKIAKKLKAIVLKNKKNLGPDKSIEKGIKKAGALNYKFIITFDADDQHPYNQIPKFLNLIKKEKADIVVGERKKLPRISEYFFSLYASAKINVPDPINGFKAFKYEIIREIGYFDKYKSLTSEILFNAYKKKYKIISVPINIKKRFDVPRIGGLINSNIKIMRSLIITILKNI
jgi:glycosyltransferase involved in cell wall biosynthesis